MNNGKHKETKSERREKKRKPKMKVSGAKVRQLRQIIAKKSK